jgi:hypothetical protein
MHGCRTCIMVRIARACVENRVVLVLQQATLYKNSLMQSRSPAKRDTGLFPVTACQHSHCRPSIGFHGVVYDAMHDNHVETSHPACRVSTPAAIPRQWQRSVSFLLDAPKSEPCRQCLTPNSFDSLRFTVPAYARGGMAGQRGCRRVEALRCSICTPCCCCRCRWMPAIDR